MQIHDQLTLDRFNNPDQVLNTFRISASTILYVGGDINWASNDLKPKERVITILTLFQRRDALHHMLSDMGISSTGTQNRMIGNTFSNSLPTLWISRGREDRRIIVERPGPGTAHD
ncbi:unnamed protein product [Clonostachys rhizophaga]|uniref:Uncharacterized protein n=1 Tax=Clonostachys rhizophaga TaxID=160324 RepID=A0A9N9YGP7_9HYPO|nr:unnamed protein product [Clonostachys rhizophaga]